MRRWSQGKANVAATPDAALNPRATLSVASVMPRHLRSRTNDGHDRVLRCQARSETYVLRVVKEAPSSTSIP